MLPQVLQHVLFGPLLILAIIYTPLIMFILIRSQQSINSYVKGVEVVIKKTNWDFINRFLLCSYAFIMPMVLHLHWKIVFYEKGMLTPFILGVFCGVSSYFIAYYYDPMVSELNRLKVRSNFMTIGDFTNGFDVHQTNAFRERILTTLNSENRPLVFLCTSFQHGEGKSIVAASLAKSFSRIHSRVLLMELDPWCDLPNRFVPVSQRNTTLGISDFILGGCELQDLFHVPAEESFTVMPRGNKVDKPYDVLNSPKILEVIRENMEHFSVIVIDGPTISQYPELSRLLTEKGVMVMALSHQTQWGQLKKINDFVKRFSLKNRICAILTRNQ